MSGKGGGILRQPTELARRALHRFGLDVVRYPHPGSLGAHLRHLLPHLSIDRVIDVGAHRGEYGRFLRKLGFDGRIDSFEPSRVPFEDLSRDAARDRDWVCHQVALGATDGERHLHVYESTDFSSFHGPSAYGRRRFGMDIAQDNGEVVPVRRLDHLFDSLQEADPRRGFFLKIDVQGSELDVLQGSLATLPSISAVQLEVSVQTIYVGTPGMCEILPWLAAYGFVVSGLFPVSIDRQSRAVVEFDAVLVRTTGTP